MVSVKGHVRNCEGASIKSDQRTHYLADYALSQKHAKASVTHTLQDNLLKKWGQSDVDPQEFKRIIRSS